MWVSSNLMIQGKSPCYSNGASLVFSRAPIRFAEVVYRMRLMQLYIMIETFLFELTYGFRLLNECLFCFLDKTYELTAKTMLGL